MTVHPTEETRVDVPEGDGLIVEGRIVSLREKVTDWGTTLKMTVKVTTPEGVYLVWGTRPRALDGVYGCLTCGSTTSDHNGWVHAPGCADRGGQAAGFIGSAEVGDVVRFTANVTRGDRDPSFGFFHRPRKASVVAQVTCTEDEGKR